MVLGVTYCTVPVRIICDTITRRVPGLTRRYGSTCSSYGSWYRFCVVLRILINNKIPVPGTDDSPLNQVPAESSISTNSTV